MLILSALLCAPPALAHGGFHESESVGEVDAVGQDPTVVTNYGLLSPVEGSPDWSWVCEEVMGPEGFSATLEVDGRWLLGSFDGLKKSDDLCDWPEVQGELEGLYITGLYKDTQVEGRVWATSSTGDAANALWRSDDRGDTWVAAHTFGTGTTLRGMGQDPSGLPMWVLGWDDLTPLVWVSTDGKAWQHHELPTEDLYSLSMLGVADGGAYARFSGSETDALVRIEVDGRTTELFRFEDVITAFDAGPDSGTLYVGGKELGLYHSLDGGQSWSEPLEAPEPGCLLTRGSERFVCSHNWTDGAAILRTPLQGGDPADWEWEEVLWFGDVRGLQDCPEDSDTMRECAELWENASPEAGFDQERDHDSGAGDSGSSDTGKGAGEQGCCSGSEAGLLLLPAIFGLGAIRRRR